MKYDKDTKKLELKIVGYVKKAKKDLFGLQTLTEQSELYLLLEGNHLVPVSEEQLEEIKSKLNYELEEYVEAGFMNYIPKNIENAYKSVFMSHGLFW